MIEFNYYYYYHYNLHLATSFQKYVRGHHFIHKTKLSRPPLHKHTSLQHTTQTHAHPQRFLQPTWRLSTVSHGEFHLHMEPVSFASWDEGRSQPVVDVVGKNVADGVSSPIIDLFPLVRPRHFLPS